MAYGTLQIFDTIDSKRVAADEFISKYDERTLYQQLQVFLEAHNRLRDMMMSDLVETTTERFLTFGQNAQSEMIGGDEFSRPDAQKIDVEPVTMGFPLYLKQAAYQVTTLFMETRTIGDLEKVILAATDADIRETLRTIRRTLFNPTNNLTYKDRLVDKATLQLRALVNADSTYIPPDQFGNVFDPVTHTHFLGTASFIAANLTSLIDTVLEHYARGTIRVYINRAQETTVRGFAGFLPYHDSRITPGISADHATGTLDIMNPYNRPIGIFGPAEIWVKPWIPANYLFAFNTAAPKTIYQRIRNAQRGSLRVAAEIPMYPLRATFLEREYGMSIYERTNGACLKTDNASYSAPPEWTI